jgi:cytochrome c556
MRAFFLGVAILAVTASAVSALEDPIVTRKKLMDANGAAAGAAFGMVKGEIPFDAKVAKAALQAFNSVSYAVGDYFPEGSDKGDTKARPEIWTDRAGFEKILADFRAHSEAALKAQPQDVETFKTLVAPIGEACNSCHEKYRVREN